MTPPLRFGIVHDFRCPAGGDITMPQVYRNFRADRIRRGPRDGTLLVYRASLHRRRLLFRFVPVAAALLPERLT